MGSRKGHELTSHVAADSISLDSLSFAALLSIQEKQPQSHAPSQDKHYEVSKQDPEFEFSIINENSNSGANPVMKITPADVLISNGQIQPLALAFQPNKSLITNPPISSLRSLLATDDDSYSKMYSSEQTECSARKYEQLGKASKDTNKESSVTRTWLGQKVFKSFVSPCRECQAIEPGTVR